MPTGWYPDLFVARVDAFFGIVPCNVEVLRCPKVLVMGDSHHGFNPLNKMIEYATSEKYDFYITDFDRHHLWYYWLAGLKDLYWLPTLVLNPPEPGFEQQPFLNPELNHNLFRKKTIFIGQVGQYHPRRKRLIEHAAKNLPNFICGPLNQRDSLKAFAAADISLNISLNGDANMRNFEVIASKGFLLADKLTDESGMSLLLEEGKEYATFADLDEMLAKISYFSQNPNLITSYREQSHARYCREYAPNHILSLFNQLVQGQTIEDRFTAKSINRIQYCQDTEFSRGRISLYQVVQDIHREWENVAILLDARVKLTSVVDFLDLPRVQVSVTNYQDAYVASLNPYLEHSGNYNRVSFIKDYQYNRFNVIITSICDAYFLSQLPNDNVVIISTDYSGVETASQYREFMPIISSKEDFEGSFFVLRNMSQELVETQSGSQGIVSPSVENLPSEASEDLLPNLSLREVNLIVFPDWCQSEEVLSLQLEDVIRSILMHPEKSKITLLLDTTNIGEEEVNLMLSSVVMNLLLQEDLDVTDGPEIALLGELSQTQWEALLSQIHYRLVIEPENQQQVIQAKADKLTGWTVDRAWENKS